ncbi:MAG TPA: hypothetical protein VF087_14165 [Solirubrobacteraceae bacterium]
MLGELLDDCDEHPPLRITLPDGSAVEGAGTEAALSELLERRVHLARPGRTTPRAVIDDVVTRLRDQA